MNVYSKSTIITYLTSLGVEEPSPNDLLPLALVFAEGREVTTLAFEAGLLAMTSPLTTFAADPGGVSLWNGAEGRKNESG